MANTNRNAWEVLRADSIENVNQSSITVSATTEVELNIAELTINVVVNYDATVKRNPTSHP